MFGFFSKKDKKNSDAPVQTEGVDVSHLSNAKQQLFAQLKAKREELGPEEIAKMQKAVKLDAMKKQMKSDIENDEDKRNRLLDELRFNMKDKG
jgi:hypothetical protein